MWGVYRLEFVYYIPIKTQAIRRFEGLTHPLEELHPCHSRVAKLVRLRIVTPGCVGSIPTSAANVEG